MVTLTVAGTTARAAYEAGVLNANTDWRAVAEACYRALPKARTPRINGKWQPWPMYLLAFEDGWRCLAGAPRGKSGAIDLAYAEAKARRRHLECTGREAGSVTSVTAWEDVTEDWSAIWNANLSHELSTRVLSARRVARFWSGLGSFGRQMTWETKRRALPNYAVMYAQSGDWRDTMSGSWDAIYKSRSRHRAKLDGERRMGQNYQSVMYAKARAERNAELVEEYDDEDALLAATE